MRIALSLLFLLTCILIGCSDSNTSSNSSGNELTGTVTGKVALLDKWGQPQKNASGVKIEFEGTTFSTISDSNGSWRLDGLPTRTYSVSFSKQGYSTYKNTTFVFVGGGIVEFYDLNPISLGEIPTFTYVIDAIQMPTETSEGQILGHVPAGVPNSVSVYTYVIMNSDPNLTIDNPFSYAYVLSGSGYSATSATSAFNLNVRVDMTTMRSLFTNGQQVFFKGYPMTLGFTSYHDAKLQKDIYSGYGQASNVVVGVMN